MKTLCRWRSPFCEEMEEFEVETLKTPTGQWRVIEDPNRQVVTSTLSVHNLITLHYNSFVYFS